MKFCTQLVHSLFSEMVSRLNQECSLSLSRSSFLVTYTDAGVRCTKMGRNNRKTAQRMVMTFPCPIKLYDSSMAEEISRTPQLFKGIWFHTTEVKSEISLNGWNPQRIRNSIYGTAIYLAHQKWDIEDLWPVNSGRTNPVGADILRNCVRDPNMFVCVLALQANEVQSRFPTERVPNGNTGDHLLSDHFKSGQQLSLQNRPTGLAVWD